MAEKENSAYYAVIPADVRYDADLPPNAKLLYGEATSLANKKGYCWATNEYFAGLYGLSVKTISRLIGLLEAKGYIRCEMVATEKGSERRIYAGAFFVTQGGMDKNEDTPGGVDKNAGRGMDKNAGRGLRKNVHQNNKEEYIKEDNTPLPPKGDEKPKRKSKYALAEDAKPLLRAYVGEDYELAKALADFIEIREAKKAINSKKAIEALLKKLDELSGGDREVKLLLIQESIANSWKSVFPLKRAGPTTAPPSGRVIEERGTYEL